MNTSFSDDNTSLVMSLISKLESKYCNSIYTMTAESLHITLLDWIAPLVDYDGQDKKMLFEKIYDSYDNTMTDIFADEPDFEVVFDTISVGPTTIFISGHDNGSFDRIRRKYIKSVDLIAGTKLPPSIIHSSLARFTEEIDLEEVESFVSSLDVEFIQRIDGFRLMHTSKEPMQEFEILKEYKLNRA